MSTRVLIVEDDVAVRMTLRLLLEEDQYEVIEAADGETGLARAESEHIDLALVDLKLPGCSGFDVCRSIRAVSDMPIIVVTAQVDSYDMVAGLEAGADDYGRSRIKLASFVPSNVLNTMVSSSTTRLIAESPVGGDPRVVVGECGGVSLHVEDAAPQVGRFVSAERGSHPGEHGLFFA